MKSYDKVIFVKQGKYFQQSACRGYLQNESSNWLPNSMSRGDGCFVFRADKPKINVLLSSHDMNISNHENSEAA